MSITFAARFREELCTRLVQKTDVDILFKSFLKRVTVYLRYRSEEIKVVAEKAEFCLYHRRRRRVSTQVESLCRDGTRLINNVSV